MSAQEQPAPSAKPAPKPVPELGPPGFWERPFGHQLACILATVFGGATLLVWLWP